MEIRKWEEVWWILVVGFGPSKGWNYCRSAFARKHIALNPHPDLFLRFNLLSQDSFGHSDKISVKTRVLPPTLQKSKV